MSKPDNSIGSSSQNFGWMSSIGEKSITTKNEAFSDANTRLNDFHQSTQGLTKSPSWSEKALGTMKEGAKGALKVLGGIAIFAVAAPTIAAAAALVVATVAAAAVVVLALAATVLLVAAVPLAAIKAYAVVEGKSEEEVMGKIMQKIIPDGTKSEQRGYNFDKRNIRSDYSDEDTGRFPNFNFGSSSRKNTVSDSDEDSSGW